MIDIKLPAGMLKAAMLFQGKNGVLFYLKGIYLNKGGYIDATNGHMAIRCQCDEAKNLDESVIIAIQGTIPASAEFAHIRLHDGDTAGLISFTKCEEFYPVKDKSGNHVYLPFVVVRSDQYPDIGRVMPKEKNSTEKVAFRAEYMKAMTDASKILSRDRWGGVVAQFAGKDGSITIKPWGRDDVTMLMMPMRID